MELQQIQAYFSQISRSLTEKPGAKDEPFWGKDGFDFKDILDIVNPLQHIPILSKFYREQTADEASEGSRLLGGLVFGGLMGGVSGAIAALTNSAVRHETQQNMGDYLIAEVTGSNKPKVRTTQALETDRMLAYKASSSRPIQEDNPFFAQLFELEQGSQGYLDYMPETELAEQEPRQRITEWGKV